MDTLTLYLVLLLSGIIIGGMIVAIALLPMGQTRQFGYRPPLYSEGYGYEPYPPRRPAALQATLLFLLLLLGAIFLARQRGQVAPPANTPQPAEQTTGYFAPETDNKQ